MPRTRVPEPSELTSASSSGSTSSPATSSSSGSQPAASADSTRSSPSATNRSSLRRQRASWSLRTVFSWVLSGEVITETKRAPRWAPRKKWFRPRLGGRLLSGALGKTSEGLGVADGDVGQHLAVQLDTGGLEAVHEGRVAHPLAAGGRVDALDPQAPEVALAVAAVAVGVALGLEDGLLGALVGRVGLAAVALGPLEGGPALLARVH